MLNNNRQIKLIEARPIAVGTEEIATFTNFDGRGMAIDLFVHAIESGAAVQITVNEVVPGTNEVVQIHQTAALTATAGAGTRIVIYPGITAGTNLISNVIGRELKIVVAIAGVGSAATITLGAYLIP